MSMSDRDSGDTLWHKGLAANQRFIGDLLFSGVTEFSVGMGQSPKRAKSKGT